MGKDYSRHQARRFVEDEEVGGPPGWNAFTPSSDYTITLFAFSWGLLPVGFMFMMLVFDRFEQHRLVVAAASLAMLVLAFFTGASQRRGSLQDGRVQLAAASLATAVVLLLLVWQLNLAEWWWTVYGTVFGSVPLMYIALDHLAKCTSQGLSQAWPIERVVPVEALGGWRIQSARWVNGTMGTVVDGNGVVGVMYGELLGDEPMLCFEALERKTETLPSVFNTVDWALLSGLEAGLVGVEEE